ncbi:cytochrome b [Rickettsiales bacterium LUAb2]
MMLKNTETQYGLISKVFHHLRLILLIAIYAFVLIGAYGNLGAVFFVHMQLAVLLFLVVLCNVIWKSYNKKINSLALNDLEKFVQKFTYFLIYFIIFTMIILGFSKYCLSMTMKLSQTNIPYSGLSVFGLFYIPAKLIIAYGSFLHGLSVDPKYLGHLIGFTHKIIGLFVLPILIAMHILALLYHQFIIKNNIIRRMF